MKSLETIQKTFHVFEILTKIAMILSFVWAGLAALGMLCCAVWYYGGTVIGANLDLFYLFTETSDLLDATGVLLTDTIFAVSRYRDNGGNRSVSRYMNALLSFAPHHIGSPVKGSRQLCCRGVKLKPINYQLSALRCGRSRS